MEDGKGCRLRGMCWRLEEDESAPGYFWKGAVRLEPKKSGSVIYSFFFFSLSLGCIYAEDAVS